MKTLVIHPEDKTTDFLSPIYSGKDWTILKVDISDDELQRLIREHDRIIMLGHGTWCGLLGYGRLVIDQSWVETLQQKKCVFIWCNADVFVKDYNLKGFYTGMIISETSEADLCKVEATWEEIDYSNALFAEAIKLAIDENDMVDKVKSIYKGNNPVIRYNHPNIYEYQGMQHY